MMPGVLRVAERENFILTLLSAAAAAGFVRDSAAGKLMRNRYFNPENTYTVGS